MKLYFKQRFFSWFDSYDVYDEAGNTYFKVDGKLGLSHTFDIYDKNGKFCGRLKQGVFTIMPKFYIYDRNQREIGFIQKQFSLFSSQFIVQINGWNVTGDVFGWDYLIEKNGKKIARISKELFRFTDTYTIDVEKENALEVLLVVLAIDAAKCDHN